MSIIRKLFGQKDAPVASAPLSTQAAHTQARGSDYFPTPEEPAPLPSNQITHDPQLIDNLMRDHVELLRIFGQINDAHQERDYVQVSERLQQFKIVLQAHILMENVKFYSYLQSSLTESENGMLMHEFRKEMNGIVRGVFGFLQKFSPQNINAQTHESFQVELSVMGRVLTQRIEREERNLYTLYR